MENNQQQICLYQVKFASSLVQKSFTNTFKRFLQKRYFFHQKGKGDLQKLVMAVGTIHN